MPRYSRQSDIGRRSRRNATVMEQRRAQSEDVLVRTQNVRTRNRNRSVDSNSENESIHIPVPRVRVADRMFRVAFNYDSAADYSMYGYIGAMVQVCSHCEAQKFPGETPGMCCAAGKVKLPVLEIPGDPLYSLLFGVSATAKHFRQYIHEYNSCFQMTSFGATNIIRDNFMPTFKVE